MAGWLDPVLGPLNTATDTLKGIVDIRDQIKFGEAVSDLYAQLIAAYKGAIDAQRHEATMLEENRTLREKVNQLDEWNAQKKRYQMEKHEPGVILYARKAEIAEGEPPHYACPNCYHRGLIRILQNQGKTMNVDHLHCHECGSKYEIGIRQKPQVHRRGPGGGGSWMST